jgi:enoyl-CoA hydratase
MTSLVNERRIGDIAVVEMNRPDVKNAMNSALLDELTSSLRKTKNEADVAAVVITGAGGAFSSGADVTEQVGGEGARKRMDLFCDLYETVTAFPKPTVAAINGPCIGGGAEVAAACDLRVGTAAVAIRFPGALFAIPVGVARLPLLVGLSHAKDLLLTGRTIGAEEAYRMGFLNRVVDASELEHEAVALASTMAAAPGARISKGLLDDAVGLSVRTASENRALRRWQRTR